MGAVGLVLGAGGAVGAAYLTGVLAALAEHTGWDPRGAELIVGTSAGAGIGAGLRAGLAPADQFAHVTGGRASPDAARLLAHLPEEVELNRPGWTLRPASLRTAAAAVTRLEPPRPGLAIAGLLPEGSLSTDLIIGPVRGLHPDPWPEQPTWICAVELGSGRRVVFGRDDIDVHLAEAVAASSAVPALFRPVAVAGKRFVDGAVHSPTNVDLVAGLGLELAIVISPMSAVPSALRTMPRSFGRGYHAALLRREVTTLRRSGTRVITIQPTRGDLEVHGVNAMDRSRRQIVATRAHETTSAKLARSEVRDLLDAHLAAVPARRP